MPDAPKLPTPAELAGVLSKTGIGEVTEAQILEDIAAGCPVEPDGRMNVVNYVAWLLKSYENRR